MIPRSLRLQMPQQLAVPSPLLTPPLPRVLCQNTTLLCLAASQVWGKSEQQGLQLLITDVAKELTTELKGALKIWLWHRWALSMGVRGGECGWQQDLCRYLHLLLFLWVYFTVGLLKLLQSL